MREGALVAHWAEAKLMDELIRLIMALVGGSSIGVVAILIFVFLNPEKVEKWSAIFWLVLSKMGTVFKSAHKQYVKHDMQGRINEFVKGLATAAPFLASRRVRVEWTDGNITKKSLIEDGTVILRLRRDDHEDVNFVNGSYMYVSTSLLFKAKRYITPSQRDAVDLFVCTKLLEAEKPEVVSIFLAKYLHPTTDDAASKVAMYIDDFAVVDSGRLFFPIFLQELEYLGDKVFGKRRDDVIGKEVDGLVAFLKPIANRAIGDLNDLNFDGSYCRFGIVMVGKPQKLLTSVDPYVTYIKNVLVRNDVETIYILARAENRERVCEIWRPFAEEYDCVREVEFKRMLRYSGRSELAPQYLCVLRMRGASIIQASE